MISDTYKQFQILMRDYSAFRTVNDLLYWDREICMPGKGGEARAKEMGTIAKYSHKILVSEEFGKCIKELYWNCDMLDPYQWANVREMKRIRDKQVNVPSDLVEELAEALSTGYISWKKAHENADFGRFAPTLEKIVKLQIQYSEAIDSGSDPYGVLFNEHDPYIPIETVDKTFEFLNRKLPPLFESIQESSIIPNTSFLNYGYPINKQLNFCKMVLKKVIGLDPEYIRFDKAKHPFTVGLTPLDVRISTRFIENDIRQSILSSLHERGHGWYEQNHPTEYIPDGKEDPVSLLFEKASRETSLSVHESQSRFCENIIGRSLELWENLFPTLQTIFPNQLSSYSPWDFYEFLNEVKPSFIRTDADEVTYNIHVLLRYKLESKLVRGEIEVKDIPKEWRREMNACLGITPPNSRVAELQDPHWGCEKIGYFPTYTLGTVLSAQLSHAMSDSIPNMKDQIRTGKFDEIRGWMNKNIHEKGVLIKTDQLIKEATGGPLNPEYFLKYLRQKYSVLYDL